MSVKLIRYSNNGFDKSNQSHILTEKIYGCHCFVNYVDDYLLSGEFDYRKNQRINILEVDENIEVFARNVIYSMDKNQYGYINVSHEPFDSRAGHYLNWIKLPIWVVAENSKFIETNGIKGEYGCECIFI